MKNSTEWLRLDGVADRIGLTRETVRVMSSNGKLPPPDQVVGVEGTRKWKLWAPETIDEWNRTRKDPT
jgi:predicted DNA-binding transcriptional regulator AlpA